MTILGLEAADKQVLRPAPERWLMRFMCELEFLIPPVPGKHHTLSYGTDSLTPDKQGNDTLILRLRTPQGTEVYALNSIDMELRPEEAAQHASTSRERVKTFGGRR